MIMGVAGRYGAGKGEVIKLLIEQGYEALSLSDVIRGVLREQGLEESRERMIETGNRLRTEGGPGVLAEGLLAMMLADQDYAVDSVRHPDEVEALRRSGRPFALIWVDADEAIRFERIQSRGRIGDPESLAELRDLEGRELGSSDPAAQQLDAVRELRDVVIQNDTGLDALRAELTAAMRDLSS
jgi:dephospho-CoA kinase